MVWIWLSSGLFIYGVASDGQLYSHLKHDSEVSLYVCEMLRRSSEKYGGYVDSQASSKTSSQSNLMSG